MSIIWVNWVRGPEDSMLLKDNKFVCYAVKEILLVYNFLSVGKLFYTYSINKIVDTFELSSTDPWSRLNYYLL